MGALERISNPAGRHRTVKAVSSAIPDLLGTPQLEFVRVSGREALSELFTYTVDLRPVSLAADQSMLESDLDAAIGQEMTLSIELDGMGEGLLGGVGAGVREITGLITAVELIGGVDNNHLYRYTLRPWMWLATQTSDYKSFQNKSVIDILDEVLVDYPYSVDKRLDTRVFPKLIWEVQHGETDAHFIQRLTEEWGITYFFEHDGGHHRLVLVSESGAWKKFPSQAYHALPIYPQGFKVDQEHLTRFEPKNRLRTGKVTLKDYDPRQPKADLTVSDSLPRDTHFSEFERYEYEPGAYDSREVGNFRVRIRAEERRAKGRRMYGAGNLRGIAAGCTYHITNHDHDALNREVLIVSTELTLEDVGIHSGSTQQYTCRVKLEAHPTDEVFRPALTAHKPRVQGIQRAVVTGPEDQEVWTNDHGCVKVQFEWDRYGRCDENSSPWIRVSSGWSGDQFGATHVPRIGQEVIVDFLNGDPNTPIIIGRVPNQLNTPPWSLPTQHALSGIASKELFGKRRNHLLMDDTQGQIQAQLSSDHQTSQLNLGYLTSVPGHPGRKDARGEGFDLRTDGQGSVRGAKGLFFTTEEQAGAKGGHLWRDTFIREMKAALEVAKSLGDYSSQHEASRTDTSPQTKLTQAIENWDAGSQPLICAYAPAGMAFATPEMLTRYAGKHIDTIAKLNQQYTAGQQYVVNAGTGISLFAHSGDWKAIAHRGKLILQAQSKSIELNARTDLVVSATEGEIVFNSKTGITLMSGNAGIRIADGCVDIYAPKRAHAHTDSFDVPGEQGIRQAMPVMLGGALSQAEQFVLVEHHSGLRLTQQRYRITLDGDRVIEGTTNDQGETELVTSSAFEMAQIEILRNTEPDSVIAVQSNMISKSADAVAVVSEKREQKPRPRRIGDQSIPPDTDAPTPEGRNAIYATCEPYAFGMRLAEPEAKGPSKFRYPVAQQYTDAMQALLTVGIAWPAIPGVKEAPIYYGRDHLRAMAKPTGVRMEWPMSKGMEKDFIDAITSIVETALQATVFGLPAGALDEGGAMPVIGFFDEKLKLQYPGDSTVGVQRTNFWDLSINPKIIQKLCRTDHGPDERDTTLKLLASTLYHEVRHVQQTFWMLAMVKQFPDDYPGLTLMQAHFSGVYQHKLVAVAAATPVPDEPTARIALKRMTIAYYYNMLSLQIKELEDKPNEQQRLADYRAEFARCEQQVADLLLHVGRNGRPIDYKQIPGNSGYYLRPWEDDAFACDFLVTQMWQNRALPEPDRCNANYDFRPGEDRRDASL